MVEFVPTIEKSSGCGIAIFLFILLAIMCFTYHRKWKIIREQEEEISRLKNVGKRFKEN